VTASLNANAPALFIDEVMGGVELKLKFNDPTTDSRVPDVIVQPQYGTVYTGSTAENAEHGGFSFGDTNVALIVSNPSLSSSNAEDSGCHIAGRADAVASFGNRFQRVEVGASRENRGAAGPWRRDWEVGDSQGLSVGPCAALSGPWTGWPIRPVCGVASGLSPCLGLSVPQVSKYRRDNGIRP
jgi:hypothetical protein